MDQLARLNQEIIRCKKCPRLVKHREEVAKQPPKRYQGQSYWARPLPGFGDPAASIYIVGLAPAANGGNRTGRIFTGDRSGDWLFSALHEVGLASQPESISAEDGMQLRNVYIGAAVRCAPPDNKPKPQEFENCRFYLVREQNALKNANVIIALGSLAYDSVKKVLRIENYRYPPFGHGQKAILPGGKMVLCSYHPSQQNTFTGKLTRDMFLSVFKQAKEFV